MPIIAENIDKAVEFLRDKLSDEDLATFEELARNLVDDDPDDGAMDGAPSHGALIRMARKLARTRLRGGAPAQDSRARISDRPQTEAERIAFDARFPNAGRIGTPSNFGIQGRPPSHRLQTEAERRAFLERFPEAERLK